MLLLRGGKNWSTCRRLSRSISVGMNLRLVGEGFFCEGISVNRMAKLYGVHRNTVKKFILAKRLDSVENFRRTVKMIG